MRFWAAATAATAAFFSVSGSDIPRFDVKADESIDLIRQLALRLHRNGKLLILTYDSIEGIESQYARRYSEALFEFQRAIMFEREIKKGIRPVVFVVPTL